MHAQFSTETRVSNITDIVLQHNICNVQWRVTAWVNAALCVGELRASLEPHCFLCVVKVDMGVTIKGKPGNARFKVDSDDSDDEEVQVSEERYLEALTASGLGRAEDFSVAAEELTLLLTSGTYSTAFSKGAQTAVLKDIATAVAACSR